MHRIGILAVGGAKIDRSIAGPNNLLSGSSISNTFFGDRDYHATSSFDLSEAWSIDLLGLEPEVENARRELI